MVSFTGTISDPSNQIKVYDPPAKTSALSAITQAAAPILGNLIATYKEGEDQKKVDNLSAQMEQEYRTLAEARRQGAISSTDFYTRLDAKARQLAADFPTVAKQFREKVQQDFGDLQGLGFKQEINSFDLEEKNRQKDYLDAQSHGIQVYNKNGTVDEAKTVAAYRSIQGQILQASLAAKSGADDAAAQVNTHIQGVFSTAIGPLYTQLGKIMDDPSLSIPDKVAQATQLINNGERTFKLGVLNPILSQGGGIKVQDAEAMQKYYTDRFQELRTMVSEGDKAAITSNLQLAENAAAVQIRMDNPALAALKTWDKDFANKILENAATTSGVATGLGRQVGSSLDHLTNMKNSIDNPNLVPELPPESRKPVIKDMQQKVTDVSKKPSLNGQGEETTFLASLSGLNKQVLKSNNTSDMEKQLDNLSNSAVMAHVTKTLNGPLKGQANEVLDDANKVAMKYLQDKQWQSTVGNIPLQFNNSTGLLEIKPNIQPIQVRGEITTMTHDVNQGYASRLKPYNQALQVLSKAAKARGEQASEATIRKAFAEGMGYIPAAPAVADVLTNMQPTTPEQQKNATSNPQPVTSVSPNSPPNLPSQFTDAEGNKFILGADGLIHKVK